MNEQNHVKLKKTLYNMSREKLMPIPTIIAQNSITAAKTDEAKYRLVNTAIYATIEIVGLINEPRPVKSPSFWQRIKPLITWN